MLLTVLGNGLFGRNHYWKSGVSKWEWSERRRTKGEQVHMGSGWTLPGGLLSIVYGYLLPDTLLPLHVDIRDPIRNIVGHPASLIDCNHVHCAYRLGQRGMSSWCLLAYCYAEEKLPNWNSQWLHCQQTVTYHYYWLILIITELSSKHTGEA